MADTSTGHCLCATGREHSHKPFCRSAVAQSVVLDISECSRCIDPYRHIALRTDICTRGQQRSLGLFANGRELLAPRTLLFIFFV